MAFDINDRTTWAWIDGGNVTKSWADDGGYAINPNGKTSFYQFTGDVPVQHNCALGTGGTEQLVFDPRADACVFPQDITEAEIHDWAVGRGLVQDQR